MLNIVLCGGAGKRLWPLSAGDTPKQFIKFGKEESLYIKTIRRNMPLCDKTSVLTNQKYSDQVDKQLTAAKLSADIILESSCKGTASSIIIACLMYPETIILATPSDHEINNDEAYQDSVKRARDFAEKGSVVVFGIESEKPEDRFGYIQADSENVIAFHEKPDSETALKYMSDGYLINSGILCFNSDVMLCELIKYLPDQVAIARKVIENIRSGRATHRLCGRFMGEMTTYSIDSSVLEKSDKLKCVKGIKGWRDVGTYESIYEHRSPKVNANLSLNIGESFGCADFVDSEGCMVLNREQDVVVCGLDDVVVVEYGGKILIAKKGTDIEKALKKLDG
ncbi:Mannose-1-phosphate guanylyltransferase [Denitrovibrio acetiphilus DSM 12809]|uniref:Mannose-1-phosphate guanylyltransferase n=1 Tax=Denitrovibrio acetiphilus (strain DSM 12809 / NBRC 114555 / N2460) TaxID=522772 RepID=D4H5T9_DENA2|nr:sugar phosphate nucleotidyltransferase [Denitrovibrio acetiphilus]ADD69530.1 Mannose-1-phosphate guanylyltransferase [Denitrovibrio acetiphilus DSM 12809]